MKTVLAPEELVIANQRFILRDVTPADMNDVLTLHHQVFGSAADAQWYDWKYVRGQGEGVGLWQGGELVAFCGGTPRQVIYQGAQALFLQIGDVMVAPMWRGVFTRKSPFFYVSERLYRSRLGQGNPYAAGFGFPNQRHLRLAVKTGLSHDAGTVAGLQWLLNDPSAAIKPGRSKAWWQSGWWQAELLDPASPGFDAAVNHCWAQMRAAHGAELVGVRDAPYLRWRFVERPDKQYRFVAIRRAWRRRPVGIAVLGQPVTPAQALPWLDWVGPQGFLNEAWAKSMQQARRDGAAGLTTWASPAMEQALAHTQPHALGTVAGVGVPVASTLSAAQVSSLNSWWTGGDTDFL